MTKSSNHIKRAYFAAGCFWGVEFYLSRQVGVLATMVGYMGGFSEHPTYEQVCSGSTGHFEVVEVVYDSTAVSYEQICRVFFEIHDFTQTNGQGPDLGQQYLSVLFYANEEEMNIGENLIAELRCLGYEPATRLLPVSTFWPAEEYHRNYYDRKGSRPYCHSRRRIFPLQEQEKQGTSPR